MDLLSPSGYFAKRIKLLNTGAGTLMSFPFKARLWKGRALEVLEYEEIGEEVKPRELLEYPEDRSKPAYAKQY